MLVEEILIEPILNSLCTKWLMHEVQQNYVRWKEKKRLSWDSLSLSPPS